MATGSPNALASSQTCRALPNSGWRFEASANVVPSYNQIYMAGLMTAPMVILELLLMGDMYPNKKRNIVILACSSIALLAFWVGIRQQVAVGDVQMLKSMIPHHAGAVLMCGEAALSDSEAKELCRTIVSGQQAEIAKMKDMLTRLQR